MTAFKRGAARIGAALAIAALTLGGITATQLVASAAPGDVVPWNPDPADILVQDLSAPGAEIVPPGNDFLACLDAADPSVTTFDDPSIGNLGYVTRIERSFPTVRAFIAAGSQIEIPIMSTPCATEWGLTGRYWISDASVSLSSFGTSTITEQVLAPNEALELAGNDLVIPNAHEFSDGSFANSWASQVWLERADGSLLQGQLYHVVQINELAAAAPEFTIQAYNTLTITPADLLADCALGGSTALCEADGSYFTELPVGATTTVDADGNEVLSWTPLEEGTFTFEFVITDSVEGVSSAPQTGTITVTAFPDFLGTATAPSKNFSILAGESITVTHDLLGDVYAIAFEGDEPRFIDPWLELSDGSRVPHWTVVYLDAPNEGRLVDRTLPGGETVTELVFSTRTPGVYYFTYRIEINSKGFGFVTPPITSTITVTAEIPELPKVTG